jgi:septum formation protein
MELILASGSPRRHELMKALGFTFRVATVPFEEVIPDDVQPMDAAKYLAEQKNIVHQPHFPGTIILTADTTVILNNEVLGKCPTHEEAYAMVARLSGQTHMVVTGCCVSQGDRLVSWQEETLVTFHELTTWQIKRYVDFYTPFDKAGAYGVQDWIGMVGVKRMEGTYFNVMGLPTDSVYRVLTKEFGLKGIL